MNQLLEERLKDKDGVEFATILLDAGVPAGAAMSVPEALNHPHTKHRNMVVEKDGYSGTGIPIKMGRTPGSVQAAPPAFGVNGKKILQDYGYSEEKITSLLKEGVLWEEPKV